jgi:hypothetical protein
MGLKFSHGRYDIVLKLSITLPIRIFATLKVTSDITNHNTVLQCLPETLHFPDTGGLKLQAKVFLSKGELGLPGSTYVTESVVKQEETGRVVYTATGAFILNPIKFLATEFRYAIANKEFEVLWKKLDINGERTLKGHLILSLMMMPRLHMTVVIRFSLITGDGVVSREELQQFVRSSGMANLVNFFPKKRTPFFADRPPAPGSEGSAVHNM